MRDLGPNARKAIKSTKDKQIKNIQKYVLDNMQDLQTPDEMYLLVLAGLVPIQKVHRLERLIPAENIRLKQEADARNGIDVAAALIDSDSSENYETEDLETSGRDTEYE